VRDVFSIQDEIVESIADALRPRFGEAIQPRSGAQTSDLEAYVHYLRGRFCWNQRSEEGLRAGVRHFGEAIRLDGHYARAYSGLADCQVLLAMAGVAPARENMAPAKQAAMRALELNSRLAEAHTSLAATNTYEWDRENARKEFDRALELDPGYANLHHWIGCFYHASGGQLDAALEHTERGRELDPLSLPIIADLALLHWFRDELEAGLGRCQECLEIDPHFYRAHWYLGLIQEQRRVLDQAEVAYREALRLCGQGAFFSRIEASLGRFLALTGREREARQLLQGMQQRTGSAYVSNFDLANVFVGLREDEAALRHLDKAVRDQESFLIFLRPWPPFRKLFGYPEFQETVARMESPRNWNR
jgi:serine/threonine-protein kinase